MTKQYNAFECGWIITAPSPRHDEGALSFLGLDATEYHSAMTFFPTNQNYDHGLSYEHLNRVDRTKQPLRHYQDPWSMYQPQRTHVESSSWSAPLAPSSKLSQTVCHAIPNQHGVNPWKTCTPLYLDSHSLGPTMNEVSQVLVTTLIPHL